MLFYSNPFLIIPANPAKLIFKQPIAVCVYIHESGPCVISKKIKIGLTQLSVHCHLKFEFSKNAKSTSARMQIDHK